MLVVVVADVSVGADGKAGAIWIPMTDVDPAEIAENLTGPGPVTSVGTNRWVKVPSPS